jgi:hypothetical protein
MILEKRKKNTLPFDLNTFNFDEPSFFVIRYVTQNNKNGKHDVQCVYALSLFHQSLLTSFSSTAISTTTTLSFYLLRRIYFALFIIPDESFTVTATVKEPRFCLA